MSIKFEQHDIENVQGTGKRRPYVQLKTIKAKTLDELAEAISHSCTATKADIKAVLTELCHVAVEDLSSGTRFYLPEMGYLSLAVRNTPVDKLTGGKITGNDIYLKTINFKPEKTFLKQIRERVKFAKSKYSSVSTRYTEEKLWALVETYLQENAHITRHEMCVQFGMTYYVASQWLDRFLDEGRLTKEVFGRQSVYSLA